MRYNATTARKPTARTMKTCAAVTLTALLAVSPAHVGPSVDTEGFFLSAGIHSSHAGTNGPSPEAPVGSVFVNETGAGVTLSLGYGLTPSLPLRLVISATGHPTNNEEVDVTFSSGTLELAYLFQEGQPLRPYVFGGFGGYTIESQEGSYNYKTEGPGAVLGAGLLYFFGQHFGLEFAVRGEFINWEQQTAERVNPDGSTTTVESPIDDEGSAAKFLVGGAWWF